MVGRNRAGNHIVTAFVGVGGFSKILHKKLYIVTVNVKGVKLVEQNPHRSVVDSFTGNYGEILGILIEVFKF